MDQVKFAEDSLQKFWRCMVYLSYLYDTFKEGFLDSPKYLFFIQLIKLSEILMFHETWE